MTTPQNPPSAASGTAPFTTREHLCRLAASGHGVASAMDCEKTIQVGIFFDGTNNNRDRDKAESPTSHSNIVRRRGGFEGGSAAKRRVVSRPTSLRVQP